MADDLLILPGLCWCVLPLIGRACPRVKDLFFPFFSSKSQAHKMKDLTVAFGIALLSMTRVWRQLYLSISERSTCEVEVKGTKGARLDPCCRDFFDSRGIRKVLTFLLFRRLIAEHTACLDKST